MLKLLLLSIVLATFLVPAYSAKTLRRRPAFQGLLVAMVAAEVGYAFFLYFLYFRFV